MTVPLNGSGIDLSLQAGKLLASAVMAAEKNSYKKEDLWQYQYRYFTLFGNNLVPISILRRFFGVITGEDIDFFLEKGILSEKEIGMAGGISGNAGVKFLIGIIPGDRPGNHIRAGAFSVQVDLVDADGRLAAVGHQSLLYYQPGTFRQLRGRHAVGI